MRRGPFGLATQAVTGSYPRPVTSRHDAQSAVEDQAALASTAEVAALVDRIDLDAAGDDDVAVHRLLVNANKYATSVAATDVVHRAIEVLERRCLAPGYDSAEDPSYLARIDAVLTEGPHADGADRVGRPDAIEVRA